MDAESESLWRALQKLRSVACYLMVGAHPDDEWNGFLAWLAFGRGVHTVYACSTRGEGGQSVLGPERGRALAAIRSREMECAAAEIDLSVRWLGAGPANGAEDPIFDFGFSRSGQDSLRRWGEARLTERLVRLIRTERPDAVSPTFLDVPGQHGHHRAMTSCLLRAIGLAADPAYVVENGAKEPWRVAKTYLPAFSGAGLSYDDRERPPPETVRVDLGEHCDALGASWAQIGERSRTFHASQGMGRDLPDGPRPLALHLLHGLPDAALPMDGLAHGLADLAGLLADGPASQSIQSAGRAITDALVRFPEKAGVAVSLHEALAALARTELPDGADDIARRLALKRRQISRAAALTLGIGGEIKILSGLQAGRPVALSVTITGGAAALLRSPVTWRCDVDGCDRYRLDIPADTVPFGTLRDSFDPLGGNDAIGLTLGWEHGGSRADIEIDPAEKICLAPAIEVGVTPQRIVRRLDSTTPVMISLTGAGAPASWPLATAVGGVVELRPEIGRHDLEAAGTRLARFAAPHVGGVAIILPASVSLLRLAVEIPHEARVGVVAGISDETLLWLQQLDIAAEPIDDAMLATGDLGRFTTILVGIFGFGQRPALRRHRNRIIAWTSGGGSLVTMYHRPEDGWDEGRTPPLHLLPGRPSLRWRVTDPEATVTVLAPDHPLLRTPNVIGDGDWAGWVRERGLYFASAWDQAYTPLLEMADDGEPALQGALLAAPVGAGRHVHVALALHHQFQALVPGAFRLLANLVAPIVAPPCGVQSSKNA